MVHTTTARLPQAQLLKRVLHLQRATTICMCYNCLLGPWSSLTMHHPHHPPLFLMVVTAVAAGTTTDWSRDMTFVKCSNSRARVLWIRGQRMRCWARMGGAWGGCARARQQVPSPWREKQFKPRDLAWGVALSV